MKKQTERVVKEDEKYTMKGDTKIDNRHREEVFEVKHQGVSVDWTANITEALSTKKSIIDGRAQVWSINMNTGARTLRA